MTLKEFRASGRDVADLATNEHLAAQELRGPGRIYAEDLVIEGTPAQWCLTIENDSRCGSLPALEEALYRWAVDCDYLP
jgi:hypothetical protein